MDDSLFNDYIERVILPLYPNIAKTARFDPTSGKLLCGPVILKVDAGPGRMVADIKSITKRAEFLEMGLLILMGLPNSTSVNQEMDVLYGPFKSSTYARQEVIVTERMRLRSLQQNRNMTHGQQRREEGANDNSNEEDGDGEDDENIVGEEDNDEDRQAAAGNKKAISISFNDLATVVDGKVGDPIDMKPFSKYFTEQRILGAWAKVGFVPFTRNCVNNRKVRHELGQIDKDVALEELYKSYEELVNTAESDGLNAGVFDATIPVAAPLQREPDEEDQVKQLLETKGAFSVSRHWNVCGSRIGNSSVVLEAQKQQLARDAEKAAMQMENKVQRQALLLTNAQRALEKHENANASMKDKDWIDIIRWVLPESKAGGNLKDLKKKDAIILKLQSLDRDWKLYISRPVQI
jgi:hypothetical protein